MMSAEYDPNEVLPAGTIVYPEIEALRYLIQEQKERIKYLEGLLETKKQLEEAHHRLVRLYQGPLSK